MANNKFDYNWINVKKSLTKVSVKQINLSLSNFWFFDINNGRIINRNNSFFSIYGAEYYVNNHFILEQPIIIQNEVGYLGIICKIVEGMPYFLMQAKIEPGNVNFVQISPTIQATKSNFTRSHGGVLPKFFEVFEKCSGKDIIYDQLQPEQSARFFKKFNRNIIIKFENENIKDTTDFRWISYVDLCKLLYIENLVNMDTRTVISGLPYNIIDKKYIKSLYWLNSIYSDDIDKELNILFHHINNHVMFNSVSTVLKPLNELRDWNINDEGITCTKDSNFDVKYFDISIDGREVQDWTQPLFCSKGEALFGVFIKKFDDEYKILVRIRRFIGSSSYEIAPAVQLEYNELSLLDNRIDSLLIDQLDRQNNVIVDVLLSEEGGRFYHEQNRNVIIELTDDIDFDSNEYLWLSLGTIKYLIRMSSVCNIQLRNLISLISLFN